MHKSKWLAGFLTFAIGIGICVAIFRRDFGRNVPLLDGSTMTIVQGVHLLGKLGPAAAYAVETSEGLILVDSGLDADAQSLKSQMTKLGLDRQKLLAILLTHVHGDHCGGAEHLRAATGAKVYAGRADVAILKAGGPREAIFSDVDMPDHTPHPTTVDVALEGDEILTFGDVRVRVLGAPGHSPGSICYLVERGGLRVLLAGDVLHRLDGQVLGTYTAYLAPCYRGDAKAFLSTLHILRALPVPDLVLPGHPNSSSVPTSPQLTPQSWAAILDDGIDAMQRLVDRYEADGANFLDGVPKRLLSDHDSELDYLGDFQGAAVYGLFVSSNFFVINAPGGAGLSDFITSRLQELGRPSARPTAILLTACGQLETAGLKELIERTDVAVVVSPAGAARIRQVCPPETVVVSADELPGKGWLPVTVIPLGGRGEAPIAYLITCAGKNVLFAGAIPSATDANPLNELLADLAKSRQKALAYNAAMQRLAKVQPDLWLPSVPYHGRNANLYGREWRDIVEKNQRAAEFVLQTVTIRNADEP